MLPQVVKHPILLSQENNECYVKDADISKFKLTDLTKASFYTCCTGSVHYYEFDQREQWELGGICNILALSGLQSLSKVGQDYFLTSKIFIQPWQLGTSESVSDPSCFFTCKSSALILFWFHFLIYFHKAFGGHFHGLIFRKCFMSKSQNTILGVNY